MMGALDMAHVLIVDDDPALLQALPEALRLRMPEVAVDTAESGPAALRRLAEREYDAVVCDVKMPGMDGLAVLGEIQKHHLETPTLLITGHGEHDLAVQALRGGAYDFIQKPIERDYFVASLNRAIEKRRLSRQVEEQGRSLQAHATQLQQTVDERTVELRRANAAKDQFLATLAHELRNPLASVRHAVEVMQVCNGDRQQMDQAQQIVQRQVRHMARLLDDLLDVSRIQHGKIKLNRQRLNLVDLVNHVVETCRPLLLARQQKFSVELSSDPIWIEADGTRIEQIVANLLHNSAKYTQTGGSIHLAVQRQEQEAVIDVQDNGIGFSPDMAERIFDLFTQVEQSLDRTHGGLGIGLTLVRHLVRLHGGDVAAMSEGTGKGSQFLVRLPLCTPATADGTVTANVSPPLLRSRGRRVLLVEDAQDSRAMLGRLLTHWGHIVEMAADGPQAVEAACRALPDVALVDIGLPGLDGYGVARQIRSTAGARAVCLIALTGYGQPEDRRRSREAGFDAHLVKPVDPEHLRQLLDELPCALVDQVQPSLQVTDLP
jgi:two-component system, sensor histidine kinase